MGLGYKQIIPKIKYKQISPSFSYLAISDWRLLLWYQRAGFQNNKMNPTFKTWLPKTSR